MIETLYRALCTFHYIHQTTNLFLDPINNRVILCSDANNHLRLNGVAIDFAPDMAVDNFEMTIILLNNIQSMIDETAVKDMALFFVRTWKDSQP